MHGSHLLQYYLRTTMLFAVALALLPFQAVRASEPVGGNIDKCCFLLKSQFPNNTELAGSPSTSSYFSLQQADMTPTCRIYPASASDVSVIVKIAGSENCPFAVRSGGHMPWKGSSNIGPDGFVIDLGKMKKISTNEDNTVVSVEPGLVTIEVYAFLDPLNISVAVGRRADVGVGGFLLGGGLSFFTSTAGLASNSILNYEVVLADGSIVNANTRSEAELYYALKLGSTNYGIVTRFDLAAFQIPFNSICGGTNTYSIHQLRDVAQIALDFLDQPPQTPSLFGLLVRWDPVKKATAVMHVYAHSCAPGKDQLFSWVKSRFSEIGDYVDNGHTASSGLGDFVDKVRGNMVSSAYRDCWQTVTFQNASADFIVDVSNLIATTLEPHGVRYQLVFQPFLSQSFLTGEHPEGNPFSSTFASDQDRLNVFFLALEWKDFSQDVFIEEIGRGLIARIEALAAGRGMLHPWIYLNYADSYQAVYERSFSKKTLHRLLQAKERYDPNQVFSEYWRGGFKLLDGEVFTDSRPVDEL